MDPRHVMPNYPPAPSTSYGRRYVIVRVNNLDFGTSEATLQNFFSSCGQIHECLISRNIDTNTSRGYGYVKFYRVGDALRACRNFNGEELDGRTLQVYPQDKFLRRKLEKEARDRERRFSPSTSFGRNPRTHSLKVTNLNYKINEDDLKKLFEPYGTIADIYVPRLRYTRINKGFAFVRYYRKSDAYYAISKLDKSTVKGRQICVAMAKLGQPPPYRNYAHGTDRKH